MRNIAPPNETTILTYEEACPWIFNKYDQYKIVPTYIDTPFHRHEDFFEICLITKGSFINYYNGEAKCCEKNTLLFWKCGEEHAIFLNEPNSVCYSFITHTETMHEICGLFHPDSPAMLFTAFCERTLKPEQTTYLNSIASNAISRKERSQDFLQLFLHMALSYLFYEVPTSIEDKKVDLNEYVNDLLVKFESPDFLAMPIGKIYDLYPVCNVTLIAHFKKITGYTIVKYRHIKRMEYSAHLLANEKMSCAQTATSVGITSLSYFSKKFHDYFGLYPNEYSYKQQHFPKK